MSDNKEKNQESKTPEKTEVKQETKPVETAKPIVNRATETQEKPVQPVTTNATLRPEPVLAHPAAKTTTPIPPAKRERTNMDKLNAILLMINDIIPDKTTCERFGYRSDNGVMVLKRVYEFVSQTNDAAVFNGLLDFFKREYDKKASQQVLLSGIHHIVDTGLRARLSVFYNVFSQLAFAKRFNHPFVLDINCITRFITNKSLIRWLTIQKA